MKFHRSKCRESAKRKDNDIRPKEEEMWYRKRDHKVIRVRM